MTYPDHDDYEAVEFQVKQQPSLRSNKVHISWVQHRNFSCVGVHGLNPSGPVSFEFRSNTVQNLLNQQTVLDNGEWGHILFLWR